jgi:hypothetical protein
MMKGDMTTRGLTSNRPSNTDLVDADLAHTDLTRGDRAGGSLARRIRVAAASALCAVMVTSVAGCGARDSLVGIHAAPVAKANSAPLTVDQAKKILTRSFTAAYLGETTTGPAAKTALRTAYMSEGLRGVAGRLKLASVQPPVAHSLLLAPHPKLLAVSKGFGFPRFIVAQTVATEGGLPVLHLLVSPDAATPYRLATSAEMVPPAHVNPFDPLAQGSPLLNKGTGLAVAPAQLMSEYAAWMAFPAKPVRRSPFVPDPFSGQMRTGAAGTAKAVAVQAAFTQTHKVVPGSVYAVGQTNGGALVFGVIERTDHFAVKKGQKVKTVANKAFVLLSGKKDIVRSASITTLEFVVFAVPASTGRATLVAAREQIVAGSGS